MLCHPLTTLLRKGLWKIILRRRGTFGFFFCKGSPLRTPCAQPGPVIVEDLMWVPREQWRCGSGRGPRDSCDLNSFSDTGCSFMALGSSLWCFTSFFPPANEEDKALGCSAMLSSDKQDILLNRNVWVLHRFSFLKQTPPMISKKVTSKVWRFWGFYSSFPLCIRFLHFS